MIRLNVITLLQIIVRLFKLIVFHTIDPVECATHTVVLSVSVPASNWGLLSSCMFTNLFKIHKK